VVAARIGTCFNFVVTTPVPQDVGPSDAAEETALARSQAARRRRVLDAALRLADQGGFDAVQMRDVATEANVALGTVYRYFTSKERLLLEAMVEQIETLATRVESRPPVGETASARVLDVLTRANASLQRHPEVTAAMVRAFGAAAPEEADVVRRVSDSMTAIITGAMHHAVPSPRDLAAARVLMQVWLSSLVGWVGGVDDATRVVADLEVAAQLLLEPGAELAPASS
jgi:AcrR family transcriptional regulator